MKAANNYNVNTNKKWHVNLETIEGKTVAKLEDGE
jgi:hypothetical protein